jgi:hypothetical protein
METFKKRQKEMQRLERQRDKAAKRMARSQRKSSPDAPTGDSDTAADTSGEVLPDTNSTANRQDPAE